MGGKIAMRYAADYPEDLAGVVIEDMDCTCREYESSYLHPSEAEIDRKRKFDRAFSTWEECRSALVSFGYEEARVDGMRTEANPRIIERGDGLWSAIN
eukprot:CAMPEP_0198552700 /NCGR_PEP_ID=MMETSP1462-20131121/79132_1 /TAXON_ID=1333877 /ORGANISM="Brandtodinium nutriculum, Strain RCC3387" /LENGTH=97 /DNA_ID=CAMNT_0044283365 /DNA_START=99 /DNA_END=389 /DNA_ORIENTATION=-